MATGSNYGIWSGLSYGGYELVGNPSSGCVFISFCFQCLIHILLCILLETPRSQLIVRSGLSNGEVIIEIQTSNIECTLYVLCMIKSQNKAVAHVLLAV